MRPLDAAFFRGNCRPIFLGGLSNNVTNLASPVEPVDALDSRWRNLTAGQRSAARVLNFTRRSWNHLEHRKCDDQYAATAFSRPAWETLSPVEASAAQFLGFNQSTWDEPCPLATPASTPASTAALPTVAPGPRYVRPIIDPGCGLAVCPSPATVHCCQPSLQRCGPLPPCNVLKNPEFFTPSFGFVEPSGVFQSYGPVAVESCKGC